MCGLSHLAVAVLTGILRPCLCHSALETPRLPSLSALPMASITSFPLIAATIVSLAVLARCCKSSPLPLASTAPRLQFAIVTDNAGSPSVQTEDVPLLVALGDIGLPSAMMGLIGNRNPVPLTSILNLCSALGWTMLSSSSAANGNGGVMVTYVFTKPMQ